MQIIYSLLLQTIAFDGDKAVLAIRWGELAAMLAVLAAVHAVITRYYIKPLIEQQAKDIIAQAKTAALEAIKEHAELDAIKHKQIDDEFIAFREHAAELSRTLNWHSDILIQLATKASISIPPRPR